MQAYLSDTEFSFFSNAKQQFEQLVSALLSQQHKQCELGDIEELIRQEGYEVLRILLQGHLDSIASVEKTRQDVYSTDSARLDHIRHNTTRKMTTLFGEVVETRKNYSQRKQSSVLLMDEELNLAGDRYSDGLRFRVAQEAIKGS